MGEIGCSECYTPVGLVILHCFGRKEIGKVVKQAKLSVLSHSVPLLWEKFGKVAKWVKLAVLSHSAPTSVEKIGKIVKQAKLAILSHLHRICI